MLGSLVQKQYPKSSLKTMCYVILFEWICMDLSPFADRYNNRIHSNTVHTWLFDFCCVLSFSVQSEAALGVQLSSSLL